MEITLAQRKFSCLVLFTSVIGAVSLQVTDKHPPGASDPNDTSKDLWLRSFNRTINDTDKTVFDPQHTDADDEVDSKSIKFILQPSQLGSPLKQMPQLKNRTLENLVDAWFRIQPKSITKEMMQNLASTEQYSCTIMQIISNKVYIPRKHLSKNFYRSRLYDLAWLFQNAHIKEGDLPDVDMLVCTSDSGDELLDGGPQLMDVPVLTPVARLIRKGSIPVPMLARNGDSFWGNPWIQRLISGEEVWKAISWQNKLPKAFFRGKKGKSPCNSKLTPSPRSHCFRNWLIHNLGRDPHFNVSQNDYVPEEDFENYMFLLLVGNSGGWCDRTMQTLFKSSVAVFVDQNAYEWYMPLLVDGVHYLRVDPNPVAVISKVKSAIAQKNQIKNIVHQANDYARTLFNTNTLSKYMALVAKAYAKTLTYKPTLNENMRPF